MKFASNSVELASAIQVVQRAVSPKNPQPILSGIKFDTGDNLVLLTATDLELSIRCTVPAEVIESGKAVLPARYIGELVRRLPDLPVFFILDQDTGSVHVQYGQSEAVINGFPAEEFPEFPLPKNEIRISLPEDILKELIRQVIFAVDDDENRPVFNGVYFEIDGTSVHAVATDMHRLARRSFSLQIDTETDINFIVPGKTLNELAKIIGGSGRTLEVAVSQNQIFFSTRETCLFSRLINGRFPSYQHIIPRESVASARLKTRDLTEAVERASLLARDSSPSVRLNLQDNVMIVSANTEAGRLREELPVYHVGEPVQIAFNARYLSDVLKVVGSEEIIIEFTGPLSPGVIRPVEDVDYFSLILPVRLKEER